MASQGRQVTVGDFKAGEKEIAYVMDVLRTGRLSYGPYSRRFEEMWASAHGANHAIFCNSGTSALHIAVQALKNRYKWQDGDEVLVPSVTFVATSNVLIHNNLKPVFVDVDPFTYNMDAGKIEAKITDRTRCIIPVHLCGLPAQMPGICNLAVKYGLKVIEDSCETAFADCSGEPVGSWGDIGCFSTYMAHYIVTGVGGFAVTSNPLLAVDLRSLMNHGRDSIYLSIDDDDGLTGDKAKEVIARRFSFDHVGHSFRCTEMEAALGVAQMERRFTITARRKNIASRYNFGLHGLRSLLQLPTEPSRHEHVYMMYPIVVRNDEDKFKLVEYLEARGIETRDLLPLLGQPVYRKMFGDLLPEYPVANMLHRCGFYIGCHQYITDDDIEYVLDTIHQYFGYSRK